MDIFPTFVAVMAGASTSFFGGSLILQRLEKKRSEKPDHPPEATNQDR